MLNIYSITVIMLRLFAASYLVNSSFSIAALFALIGNTGTSEQTVNSYMAATGLGTLTFIFLAAAVLIYAKKIAGYLTRDLQNETIEFNDSHYETLQAIGFSLLGIYLLIHATPAAVKIIASYAFPAPNSSYEVSVMASGYKTRIPLPDILEIFTQLGLGLWLLIGAKGIAVAVRKAWAKGKTM